MLPSLASHTPTNMVAIEEFTAGAWQRSALLLCHQLVGLEGGGRRAGAILLGRSIKTGPVPCSRVQPHRLHAKARGVGGTGPVPPTPQSLKLL